MPSAERSPVARKDVPTDEALDGGETLRAAEVLLAAHPDALVVSCDSAGLGVPMPSSVPLGRHQIMECRSFIDYVVPEDMTSVVRAFLELLATGLASTPVRLSQSPEQRFVFHLADLRTTHGVVLGIVVRDGVGGAMVTVRDTQSSRPRYGTLRQDSVGRILGCDKAFTMIFDWTADDLVGKASLDWIHPDDQARAIEGWMAMVTTRRPHHMRYRRCRRDGQWVWLDVTLTNFLEPPDGGFVLVEMIDISAEMAAQEKLAAREQLLERLAQALPVGLLQVDAGRRVVYANERLLAILHASVTEDLGELLATVAPEHRSRAEAALTSVLGNVDVDVEVDLLLAATGERRICQVSCRALSDKDGAVTGAIVCVADITETARLHLELQNKATFDMLTRCHNRGSTMAALHGELTKQGQGRTAAIFVDLDDFKPVNDRLGHAVGDEVLVRVADRLLGLVRSGDVVGRLGGDEFLIVCPDLDGPDDALAVAQRISSALAPGIPLRAGTIDMRASIGVALSEPSMTADTLVAHADQAMYDSKRRGTGFAVLYEDGPPDGRSDPLRSSVALRPGPPPPSSRRPAGSTSTEVFLPPG